MKTKKLVKKLVLNKETISTLDIGKMAIPKGGAKFTYPRTYCTCPLHCATDEEGCTMFCP